MGKTHWKKAFNPDYIGAYSLNEGEDLIIEIETMKTETVTNSEGKKEECLIAVLKDQKPFIVNKTNAKAIAKVTGSNYLEDWAGAKIQLFVTKVKAFGEVVDALRVRDFKPKLKQKLSSDRFGKMIEKIKAGQFTKEKALARFELTAEQIKTIQSL